MVAKRGHVSIGEVLAQLREEFSDVTISKIRFLESQGLIDPERTPSGYRKFYPADVERLRFILREQRENFLPLKVIKDRLDEIDKEGGFARPGDTADRLLDPATVDALFEQTRRAAEAAQASNVTAEVRDDDRNDDLVAAATGVSMTRKELVKAAGITDDDLARLEEFGLVTPAFNTKERVLFDEDALEVARVCAGFMRHGIEPRHLRMYRAFAEREASLFEQVLLPYRRQRNPEAQARAAEALGELAGDGRRLRTALLRQSMRRSFTS
ncbi:MAG TPA: MerR family transcriptional regulator [Acidimicrobiia bacterium]|nr:MerR family transcriptional regulator [Acidimicrobiia bacterium]